MELSAFRNLFGDLQEYVCSILNKDELLSAMGAEFYSENSLDIEYQVKTALAKTGLACLVLTPRATYQGHNGIQQTFTCDELTLQIVENPVVNRPRLKRDNLDHGTAMDIAKQASDRLAGPQGGYFGKFTTKRIQEAEQSGLLVVTATFGCTVYETLSAVISGDLSGNWVEVPFVRMSELSDWIDDYLSTHMPVPEVSGYLPLSGGEMSGSIDLGNNNLSIGNYFMTDAWAAGLNIYDTATDQSYQFGGASSEWSVVRQMDLASGGLDTYEIDQYDTVIWRYGGIKEQMKLSGEVSLQDIEGLGDLSDIVAIDFGTGVTALGDYSCSGLPFLYNVHCARTLRRIGEGAFYNSQAIRLTSFVVDPQRDNFYLETNNVESAYKFLEIGTSAFANCYYLTYAQFPNLLQTYIGTDAFKGSFQSTTFSPSYPYRGLFFYGTPPAAFDSDTYINAYNLSAVSSFVRGFNPTSKEWVLEQHYGPDFAYTNFAWTVPAPTIAYVNMQNKAFYHNPLSVALPPSRARIRRVYIPELSADHTAREIYACLSVQSGFPTISKFAEGASVDWYLNGDLSTFTDEFLKPGTRHFWHFFEYEPNKFYVEEVGQAPSYLSGYVKTENSTPLTVTVPYDYGFTLQTPNGIPLIQTIDLNRTSINSLSTGNAEIGPDGYLAKYPGAGVDTTKLSAWQWLKTGETGIGSVISSEHNAILGEVAEDYVAYNWLIQQGYVTSADISSLTGDFLPLSGGQMSGGISWDYGGQGGPQIYGPYNPQQLLFQTTYAPDAQKMVFLDFGTISEADGQRTIAYAEDVWGKDSATLSVGTGGYKTDIDPGAVTIQRLNNGTLTKTMYNWDGLTYTISSEGGVPANYNLAYPLSGGTLATRQYVDAYLGDISALIHES